MDRFSLISSAPKFNLEVLGDLQFTLHMGYFELTFSMDMYPFKFTPFDIMLRMDALYPDRYCTGADYLVRTFLAQLMVEWRVKECQVGLIGRLTDND